ncbi:Hatching enzyme [Exaiptasia diaphana]|nr:Hatching enzyme [Exaiptasia diaphana]
MSVLAQKAVIAKAFKLWSDVSPLVFTLTTDLSKADITIMFGTTFHGRCSTPFDGHGKVLAHAFYPKSGQLHFDDDELFTDGTTVGTNLLAVAVHEIGHSLGLAHSTEVTSIMFPIAHKYKPNLTLSKDDKNAIRYLYAGGTSSPVCKDIWLSCASITTYCKQFRDIMKSNCKKTCKYCV